jgi:SAM-dependent methyltransferase
MIKEGKKLISASFLKEQFRPSLAGIFLNPFYFSRRILVKNIRYYSGNINGNVLDIGCGTKPYKDLFNTVSYTGIDTDTSGHNHEFSSVDVFYDGTFLPFPNNKFDSIVCFEVMEVVFNPDLLLSEANRILRNGGKALFTVPFVWDEHEQPFDYARYSSYGLKYLFEKHGFTVLESKKYLCDLRLFFLLLNAYIYKVLRRLIPFKISYVLILPLTSINNIIGHIAFLLPRNEDLYFGNIFLLEKK